MQSQSKLVVINKIAEGNFGEVILCENTYLANRKEAVKYIRTKNKEEVDKIAEIKKNLFESSVLEYLKKSKYIVEVYDAEVLKDGIRINMEFLEKGSIQNLLNVRNFLDAKQVLKISECVLHALEYAHNKGIFHLDVKPGNILIKNENIYKLSDFGLASLKNENGLSFFKEIYTIHVPPEKVSNSQVEATEQSDIYMFGVTIYRCLNGNSHLANQWNSLREKNILQDSIISGKFPNRSIYLPHVHRKFRNIINKCLNVDLAKRYKNVRDIRKDLGRIKITYNWIPRNISEKLHYWECLINNKLFMDIIAERDENNLWKVTLMKYGEIKKIKITRHCFSKLKEKEFHKKLDIIFNEFF
ncbi:MAG: serine/threonine-protein kinase [bacterium]